LAGMTTAGGGVTFNRRTYFVSDDERPTHGVSMHPAG
jgi:hypothetical protein